MQYRFRLSCLWLGSVVELELGLGLVSTVAFTASHFTHAPMVPPRYYAVGIFARPLLLLTGSLYITVRARASSLI